MKTVIIIQSGLQEYEGATYISVWGKGNGETLEEVCKDIISHNPGNGKYFKVASPDKCYDWGFELKFLQE